jgi:hypothetical protein
MKRLLLIIAAFLAAITIAVALAASGNAQQPGEQTFRLVERPSSDRFVDNPPRGTRRFLTSRIPPGSAPCTPCASRHAVGDSPA